jgi:Family of unknown function (DUF6152)
MTAKQVCSIACAFIAFTGTALAHHSLEAKFNPRQTVTLNGTVEKIEWSNPHVRLYLTVMKDSSTAEWEVEMGSPNEQMLSGWKIDSIRPGDHVAVSVYRARDGSNLGFARKISLTH